MCCRRGQLTRDEIVTEFVLVGSKFGAGVLPEPSTPVEEVAAVERRRR